MTNDDIDLVLSSEDTIVPSSGFAASVMDTLRREVEAPPPIPFPWKRALPGLVSCVGALVTLLVLSFMRDGRKTELPGGLTRIIEVANDAGVVWIAIALALSFVLVVLSMRVASTCAYQARSPSSARRV